MFIKNFLLKEKLKLKLRLSNFKETLPHTLYIVEYNNIKLTNRKIFRISVGSERSECYIVYGILIDKFNNIFNNHKEKEVKNIFENCLKINTKLTEFTTLNKLKNLQIQKLI